MKKLSWITGINWLAMMMIIISTILVVFNAVANGVNWSFWFSSVLLIISAVLVGYSLRIHYNLNGRGSSKKEDPYDKKISQKIKILSQLIKENEENENTVLPKENTEIANENNDEILKLDENKEPENDTIHRIFTMPEFKKEPEQPVIEEIVETTDNVDNSLQITIETTDEEPIEEIIVEKADKENKETSETPSEK